MSKKIKPLTEKDEIEDLVNCIKKKLYLKEDVLSALALTKKKINEVFNPDEMYWLKINEILDGCFQIQEQDQEGK